MKHLFIIISFSLFLFSYSFGQNTAPAIQWSRTDVGTWDEYPAGIATDLHGNVYITGEFNYTAKFGNTPTISTSTGYTAFIVKYDSLGNALWAKKAGNNQTSIHGITTDASGNVYISGQFDYSDSVQFGNTPYIFWGPFLVKYDSSGNVLWAKGGLGFGSANSVTTDLYGNVYIAGFCGATMTFSNTITLIGHGGLDVFIAKYDSSGNVLWARNAGSIGRSEACGIKSNAKGDVYITGYFNDSIQFGNTTPLIGIPFQGNTGGWGTVFTAKYDSSGYALWAKSGVGTSKDNIAYGIDIDMAGNAYITGSYEDTIQFGNTPALINNAGNGSWTVFITKYDAFGNAIWANSSISGINSLGAAFSITTDIYNNIYITGDFYGTDIQFGNTPILYNCYWLTGTGDYFIVKYDSLGNALWSERMGGTNFETGRGITTDAVGNIYVTGDFWSSSIQFPNNPVLNNYSPGSPNVFLAKYSYHTLVGINENNLQDNVLVYPNPAQNTINITNAEKGDIHIYNVLGEEVLSTKCNEGNVTVNVSSLEVGTYILKVVSAKGVVVRKIVKN